MLLEPLARLIHETGITDPDVLAALVPEDLLLSMLEFAEDERDEERFGKFRNLFPNQFRQVGEFKFYQRDLYQKHLEFFRAGAKYRSRCFLAANRVGKCRDYNALVSHPDGSVSRIGDLFVRAEPFEIMAWDGSKAVAAPASHVVRKPPEQMVEVLLESGHTFRASLDHRILTSGGYGFLVDTLSFVPCLPATTGERDPLTQREDDRHSLQTVPDYLDHCLTDLSPGDAQPLDSLTIVRGLEPLSADALQRSLAWSPSDGPARSSDDSPSLSEILPSSQGARLLCQARSFAFLVQATYRSVRPNSGLSQGCGRLHAAAIALAQSVRAAAQYRTRSQQALVDPSGKATNRVVAYRPAGVHALYDLTVPVYANYIADGIVHHNTLSGGGYETTCHLTGQYPPWWEGKRFRAPIRAWACGKTNETTRDIVQTTLLGDVEYRGSRKLVDGSGVIPRECIGTGAGQMTWKQGVADLVDTIRIKHVSGGWSKLGLKSYQQGRGSFEGTAQHVIWDDEEPPMDVYGEQIIRTATTRGILMLTFTPLGGLSDVVQQFLGDTYAAT